MRVETNPNTRSLDALRRHLAELVPGESLVFLRVMFGLVMATNALRYELEGWVQDLYITPAITFPYWGFGWVPRPGPLGVHLLFATVGLTGLGIAYGRFTRAFAAVFFVAFTWIELIDRSTYLNHYYLVSMVAAWMVLMPLEGRLGTAEVRRPRPRWVLWFFRAQLALVYFFAGVAKIRFDWLLLGEPLHTWLPRYLEIPLVGPLMGTRALALLMSWVGMLFDLTIPFWMLWKRSRPFAYAVVVFFHGATSALFYIGIFPFVMSGLTPIFFEPDWPIRVRRWWDSRVRKRAELTDAPATLEAEEQDTANSESKPASSTHPTLAWPLLALLSLHFVVQLLLPLRQNLYAGSSTWHEQGFRFAWNVMLIEKTGMVEFHVRSEAGETVIHPREILTPLQLRMMQTQPDMVLQFAHYLRDRWRREGRGDAEVRVDAWVSLNARPRRRFIDPEVDLARVEDGLAPAPWILPGPPELGF